MLDTWLFYVSYIALWALVIFHTLVLLEVMRQMGTGLEGAEGQAFPAGEGNLLEIGTKAPTFETPEVLSGMVIRSEALQGQPTLLVFVAPRCPACKDVAEELEAFRRRVKARLVALCQGTAEDCARLAKDHLPGILTLLDESGAVANSFQVKWTPTAVLLDNQWRVLRYGVPQFVHRLSLSEWVMPGEDQMGSTQETKLS